MATNNSQIQVEKKTVSSSRLNILIFKQLGKVWSFNISFKILLGAVIFFIIFSLSSIYIVKCYVELLFQNSNTSNELISVKKELKKTKSGFNHATLQIQLLQNAVNDLSSRPIKQIEKDTLKNKRGKKQAGLSPKDSLTIKQIKKDTLKNKRGKKQAGLSPKDSLTIKNVIILKKDNTLKINFHLFNLSKTKKIKCYLHLIAFGKDTQTIRYLSDPAKKLHNGAPKDYKLSQTTVVRKYIVITREFPFKDIDTLINRLKVIIYNQSGSLILEKEFEIKNV